MGICERCRPPPTGPRASARERSSLHAVSRSRGHEAAEDSSERRAVVRQSDAHEHGRKDESSRHHHNPPWSPIERISSVTGSSMLCRVARSQGAAPTVYAKSAYIHLPSPSRSHGVQIGEPCNANSFGSSRCASEEGPDFIAVTSLSENANVDRTSARRHV